MENETYRQDNKPNVVIIRRKKVFLARRKRLLTLVLMLLFTGIMLGTSTYAWFTSNKTVTVSDITVNVSTSSGLQISADARNFKTVVSNTDLQNATATGGIYATGTNQLPISGNSLAPVSTIGEVDSSTGFMKMYLGELKSDITCLRTDTGDDLEDSTGFCLTATQSTEANGDEGNFVAFDIFLKYTNGNLTTPTPLYLNLGSSGVRASGTSTGIENASRIAFVVEGTKSNGTAESEIQGLKAASSFDNSASGVNTVYIWEPNNDTHTSTGKNNYTEVYSQFNSTSYPATTFASDATNTASRLPWYGVGATIASTNTDSRARASVDSDYFTEMVVGNNYQTTAATPSATQLELFDLPVGITKIRVYMWVEGQDADCEDGASGGNITYSLQFSIQQLSAPSEEPEEP